MMSESSSKDTQIKDKLREGIRKAIGLNLSESEITQLTSGSPVPFTDLFKERNLSEVGSALIRAEALMSQNSQLFDKRCFYIEIGGKKIRICLDGDDPALEASFLEPGFD